MGAEPVPSSHPIVVEHHEEFHHDEHVRHRRRRAACFVGCLSHLVLLKLLVTVFVFAFMSLRAPQTVSLDPFENVALRFCPSWVRGVDIVAPFPASEWVRAHKFRGVPQLVDEHQVFNVGYNVSLRTDHQSRTHVRSYHFPAGSTFDVDFEATSPVRLMILHPEHRQPGHEGGNRWRPRGEESFRHRGAQRTGEEHPAPHHGEHSAPHHKSEEHNNGTAPESHHAVRAQFRVRASGGRYDFIFALPHNGTENARVNLRIKAEVKTLDVAHSCPIKSSLTRGERHVRVRKEVHHNVVLSASPYARGTAVVYVHLVPREHKFAVVSGILFGIFVLLRLVVRYLRAHSRRGQGKTCFWARLCGKKNYHAVPSSPIIQIN